MTTGAVGGAPARARSAAGAPAPLAGRVEPPRLRALSDAGDVVAVLLAALAGARDPRTYGLGAVALVLTTVDVLLWRAAHRAGAQGGEPAAVPPPQPAEAAVR